jgi:hypothetical protein
MLRGGPSGWGLAYRGWGRSPSRNDLGDVRRAFAAGLCVGVADRGEGTGDECHHLVDGEVGAHGAGCVRAIEQVCDMACEICRDLRGGGAQVELGGNERALDSDVLGARGHHPGQLCEQGRGIVGGGEHICLGH